MHARDLVRDNEICFSTLLYIHSTFTARWPSSSLTRLPIRRPLISLRLSFLALCVLVLCVPLPHVHVQEALARADL
jgi:hypothetical protein